MKSLGLKLHSEPLRRLCQTRGAGLKSGRAKRFRERCPLPGHQTEGERRHQKRYGPRLPRRLSRPQQDLRKARHRFLGLPRLATFSAKPSASPTLACKHQAPLRHSLSATTFAPITERRRKCAYREGNPGVRYPRPEADFARSAGKNTMPSMRCFGQCAAGAICPNSRSSTPAVSV